MTDKQPNPFEPDRLPHQQGAYWRTLRQVVMWAYLAVMTAACGMLVAYAFGAGEGNRLIWVGFLIGAAATLVAGVMALIATEEMELCEKEAARKSRR